MLARLIEFSLTQRLLVLVLTLIVIGGGVYAFRELPIDAFPDVSTTQVQVILKAPGMTPAEVEARITTPIELEMLGIPHQKILRSVSKYALSSVTIDFDEGTDIYWARQQVTERLSGVMKDLPPGVTGGLAPITTPLGEMFMFTIEGGNLTLEQRRTLLDWVIRPALRALPGVADVNSLGGVVRTFQVVPNVAAMNARSVSINALEQALRMNNRNDGAGRLTEGEEVLVVRAEGAVTTLDDVRNIVVASIDGNPVRVGDVAEVRIGSLARYGAVTKDGKGSAVEGLVLGLRGANARKVVQEVQKKLTELQPSFPKGVHTQVFYNRGSLVQQAVGTVSKALLEAVVLVLALLLLLLGNFRAAVVVAVTLPMAALITFILMRWFGMSANLMSLGGLAIAIGMLVDAAVVVVENIVTRLSEGGAQAKLPHLHRIYRAVREVSVPVASGILIIVVVFFPLLTLQGLEGKLFVPVALTIVFALSGSLLLSLTVIPVIASFLIRKGVHEEPWLVRKLTSVYMPVLGWSMTHAKIVVAGALVLLVVTGAVYTRIGKTFMPIMDEGSIVMQVTKLPSISLDQSARIDTRIQQAILSQVPEVVDVVARTGSDELGLDPMSFNDTDTFLQLKPRNQWRVDSKEWLIDQLRRVMSQFPGVAFSFTQPIQMRVDEMLTGVRGDVAVKVFGPDLDTLNSLADQLVQALKSVKGSEDVYTPKNSGVQYLDLKIDRLAAGRLGFNVDDLEDDLRALVEGQTVGVVQEPTRRTQLQLRGPSGLRSSPALFGSLRLTTPGGQTVPLADVAKVERVDGPVKIDREEAQRYVVVQSNVRGRDLVGFVNDAKAAVAQRIKLPPGYTVEWGGQFQNEQRAAKRLSIVVPVALGLIFLILFTTFGRVRQAVLVLSNIPFAMIGGVFALWISGQYLSVPASVGFIALLGIAVLNGVVMVTYFNQLRDQGMPLAELVVEGARRRLRPVMMTASIAAFGLVPLLFATGPGSEIQKPLATVVVGGLVTSTLLTLVLLPILYRRFGVSPAEVRE